MKKLFLFCSVVAFLSVITLFVVSFSGCKKENELPKCSISHANANAFYDVTLLNQFMQTPLVLQMQNVVNDLNIGITQGILTFTSSEHINKTYDTLIYFSNKWDSLLAANPSYFVFDTSNRFPVMPMLYAFEQIFDFQSLYSNIEEQLLFMESVDGIGLNNDPDTHYIESPFLRALLTIDCEVIIGNDIYIYGDSLHVKIPDLNFNNLQTVKNYISQYGEMNGMLLACNHNYAIQLLEESEEDEPEIRCQLNLNGEFVFHIQSDFAIRSCSWSFGDGTISSLHMPSHTYNSHGDYQVTAIVLFEGYSQPIVLEKTVNSGPCTVSINDFDAGGGLYEFSAIALSETEYPVSYSWSINGQNISNAESSFMHQFDVNGKKMIIVTVTFSNGCIARDTIIVKVRGTGNCCRGNDKEKEKNISYCSGENRLKHVFAIRNIYPFHRIIVKSVNYKKKNNGKYKREKANSLSVCFHGTIYDKNCENPKSLNQYLKEKSNAKKVVYDYGVGHAFRVRYHSIYSSYSATSGSCTITELGIYLHDKNNCW